ncbi:SDR family oxidoreductase [Paraburkholderia youngii]|uniref:SDR family oxidoreductase n=1 Tax=Paraburkholderia youngii TaxID=2782701 RepID=UPI003D2039DE
MGSLDSKVVLLTGGLGSLGRAQAVKLAHEGAFVQILDRPDAEGAEDVAEALSAEAGGRISYFACDLSRVGEIQAKVEALARSLGGVDILINNAALIINRPFEEFSVAEYEEQVRVNSSSAFALARACAPGMKAKGEGVIVNFCSLTLNGRFAGYVPYVASKGAMLGLTKALARELGQHGIRVNAVAPGAVVSDAESRVLGDGLKAFEEWILENQCLKRRIQPHNIADLVYFLVTPAASMITGQNIAIDGGW